MICGLPWSDHSDPTSIWPNAVLIGVFGAPRVDKLVLYIELVQHRHQGNALPRASCSRSTWGIGEAAPSGGTSDAEA
eukprot:7305343-Pyramimonas_sp.AAC.1